MPSSRLSRADNNARRPAPTKCPPPTNRVVPPSCNTKGLARSRLSRPGAVRRRFVPIDQIGDLIKFGALRRAVDSLVHRISGGLHLQGVAPSERDGFAQIPWLDREDVAGQTIENALRRVAYHEALKPTAGDRAHDN